MVPPTLEEVIKYLQSLTFQQTYDWFVWILTWWWF